MGQVTSAALTIEDEALDYLQPLFEFMVSAMSLGGCREFNPFVEFTKLFLATTTNELTPLRTINHRICPKPGSTWNPQWHPSPCKFFAELMRQLTEEEALGRIYHRGHDPSKPPRILDARDRNEGVDPTHTRLPSIEDLMELDAAWRYWSKIDLADGYYNSRIEEDLEQYSTFLITHGIFLQLHYTTKQPQRSWHHGMSQVRNL